MKVLLWTRPKDGIGGDLIQAEKTAISNYDIVHLFVLDVSNVEEKIETCNRLKIPVIISPLYRDTKYGE